MWIASEIPRSFINRSIKIAEHGLYVGIAPSVGHEPRDSKNGRRRAEELLHTVYQRAARSSVQRQAG
jgi:hypothetical protein